VRPTSYDGEVRSAIEHRYRFGTGCTFQDFLRIFFSSHQESDRMRTQGADHMEDQIRAGVVVQLKSGGPHMTVSRIREWNGRTEANCDWFEGTKAQYGSFPLTSLKIVTEERESSTAVAAGLGGSSPTSWMR